MCKIVLKYFVHACDVTAFLILSYPGNAGHPAPDIDVMTPVSINEGDLVAPGTRSSSDTVNINY